ncbi:DUF5691 domain-containing protein [Deinococcus arenicola]|uniref:DUF5691 domain-containing protein n=1 Tax=Deinococcus arenicola TaxID=2994950 RepID=A0ABU4DVE8_9DEIO|nr:DUF5691 domain-containing protein [Deinococcus sp. ZS9-10]MDV6376419.1 DUF5691 domain-containing protein [Deinococcus sp. ZS9-10]
MSDFTPLLATALVGTSRATLPTPSGTPLSDALNQIKKGDAEATLLARAALLGLATRAGRMPEPAPPLPEPAPAETLPEAPARVTRHLSAVLNTSMLPEWLSLCAAAGWRVPPSHLPDLLDWGGRVNEELRATLRPVLGERGRWLTGFSPEWRWLRGLKTGEATLDEETWEEATEAGREALFRALRSADAARGRDFLTSHFKAEKAGVRKRLLDVLTQDWQPEDAVLESLLEETILSDRSEDVRGQARRLLQRLPGSAFNSRMAERVKAMLGQEKVGLLGKLTGQRKYTLSLVDAPDADLKRDGLEPVKHAAERLRQLLSATHPGTLMTALDLKPAELVNLAAQFEAIRELTLALHTLAHSSVHDDECAAVADALLPHLRGGGPSHKPHLSQMLSLISSRCRDAELQMALGNQDAEALLPLLRGLPAPWPRELSGEVLRQLARAIRKAESQYAYGDKNAEWTYAWIQILELAQTHAAPNTPRPPPLPADAPEYARQTLAVLYAGLDLRAQMHADFKETRP